MLTSVVCKEAVDDRLEEGPPDPSGSTRPARSLRRPLARADQLFLTGFIALVAAQLWHHAMWRDELQSWDLAKTSSTIGEVISRARFEQHPPLWYVLLWVISHLDGNPRALQGLLLVLAAVMAWLVLRCCPFPRPARWLVLVGYFPAFEYSTISRPYILTVILAVVGATLWRRRAFGPALGVAMGGLVMVDDAYGAILSLGFAAATAVFLRQEHKAGLPVRRRALGTAAPWLAGVLLTGAASIGPSGSSAKHLALTRDGFFTALAAPLHAFFPLPEPGVSSWSAFTVDRLGLLPVVLLALLVVAALTHWFRAEPAVLTFWLASVGLILGFIFLSDQFGARFIGTIFMAALCSFWMSPRASQPSVTRLGALPLALLVIAQVPAAVVMIAESVTHPFSEAQAAASMVRHLPGTTLAVWDPSATAVAGYSDRPIVSTASGRPEMYETWDQAEKCDGQACSEQQLLARALPIAERAAAAGPVYLLSDQALPVRVTQVTLVRSFQGSLSGENFWIYRFQPTTPVS